MYKYSIEKLYFNEGTQFVPGQLTIIVGPNNSGKSRVLKDILSLTTSQNPETVILKDVDFNLPDTLEDIEKSYPINVFKDNYGNYSLKTFSSNMVGSTNIGIGADWRSNCKSWIDSKMPHTIRNFSLWFGNIFVTLLGTEDRLKLVKESPCGNINVEVSNLLQAFYKEGSKAETMLRKIIKESFEIDIRLDFSSLANLVFRVGESLESVPNDLRDANGFYEQYEKLDDQGDGLKSFVATVLAILVGKRPVLLLDEPEAFLHPPQAMKLGELIAQQSNLDSQVIISTHSVDLLRGILNVRQDINIIRVDRMGNINKVNILTGSDVAAISNDPLLNSARILEGLFYKGAVVVEADSDSVFYQRISRQIRSSDDIHYTHAHNKQTVAKVLAPYKKLGIRFATIVDFDVIRVRDEFKALIEKVGFNEEERQTLLSLRTDIVESIELVDSHSMLGRFTLSIEQLLNEINENKGDPEKAIIHANRTLKRIREANSPWYEYKKNGYLALAKKEQECFNELQHMCNSKGIFIVPVGELESWLVDYGVDKLSNKSRWITMALERIPTLPVNQNKEPWYFITQVHDYLIGKQE